MASCNKVSQSPFTKLILRPNSIPLEYEDILNPDCPIDRYISNYILINQNNLSIDIGAMAASGFYAGQGNYGPVICCGKYPGCYLVDPDIQSWNNLSPVNIQSKHKSYCLPGLNLQPTPFQTILDATENCFENKRLASFLNDKANFPGRDLQFFHDMARSGFYPAPSQAYLDNAKCFSCGLEVYSIEQGDIPSKLHGNHGKECKFCRKEDTSNVPMECREKQAIGTDTAKSQETALYPNFEDKEKRLQTFMVEESWKDLEEELIQVLAKKGAFSIGRRRVIFHCCGLALEICDDKVSSMDILKEHKNCA